MSHFIRLASGKGFPYRLLPARRDNWSYEACCQVFGTPKVDGILERWGRSVISYEAMIEGLRQYDVTPVPSIKNDPIYQLVLETVRKDFEGVKVKPLSFDGVAKRSDFPGMKSPGLPYKLEGFRNKNDVIHVPACMETIANKWKDIGFRKHVYLEDVCLFARTQVAQRPANKIRPTWGYPIEVYMEEGRYFYPLMDVMKNRTHNFPIAYGFEMTNGGMSMIDWMIHRNPGAKYLCIDWSRFDSTIPPWLIRDAFAILAELIDWNHMETAEGDIIEVRPDPMKRRWKRMVDYFVETPIRTCKGERFLVKTGVPSGSCWTNLIDSIINVIVTRYCMYQTVGKFPRDEMYLGDDGVVIINGIVNLDDIAALASSKFGMILNKNKSRVTTQSRNVNFLGYYNHNGYPFKSLDTLIASFIEPEHSRTDAMESCATALGQMWSCMDPGYAVNWYTIITILAKRDGYTLDDVVLNLRQNGHRHKYLDHLGIDVKSITIPAPRSGMILDVMPAITPNHVLKPRSYDLYELWENVLKRH